MIEDKLTHAERLKLECIAQAVAMHAINAPVVRANPNDILSSARLFEEWIKSATV